MLGNFIVNVLFIPCISSVFVVLFFISLQEITVPLRERVTLMAVITDVKSLPDTLTSCTKIMLFLNGIAPSHRLP